MMVLFKLIHYLAIMKCNAGLTILLSLMLGACVGHDDTAAKVAVTNNAQKWIWNNLKEVEGYQPLFFSKPDSLILSYQDDKNYKQLDDSITHIEALRFQEMGENFSLYRQRETSGFYAKKQADYRKQQQKIAKKIKPRFIGYKVAHEFMTRDTLGWQKQEKLVLCFDRSGKLQEVMR